MLTGDQGGLRMGYVLGIDLGTSFVRVAVLKDGQPFVIPNADGTRATPALVAVLPDGTWLFGEIARRLRLAQPQWVVDLLLRRLGRASEADLELAGKRFTPVELVARLLWTLRQTAEEALGEPCPEAVVTIPACFNEAQRQAVLDAGRVAGLRVRRLLHASTAAALAATFARRRSPDAEKLAVYGLGGGTFEVSILERDGGVLETLATSGDTQLGGEEFDRRVVAWLTDRFPVPDGLPPEAQQRLNQAAERARRKLSRATETEVRLPFLTTDAAGPRHLAEVLRRETLEELTGDLVERTLERCRTTLTDAGIAPQDIDRLVLVGGLAHMPRVRAAVEHFFDRGAYAGVSPEEAVVTGACIAGALLSGQVTELFPLEVMPLSLGLETTGGLVTPIIRRQATLPARASHVFSTALDHLPQVSLYVLQGEHERAADNTPVGRFEITGLPDAPVGVPQLEVTFELDGNGLVQLSARDLTTWKPLSVRKEAASGLSEQALRRLTKHVEASQQRQQRQRELADLRNVADGLLYVTAKALEEYGDQLPPAQIEELHENVAQLKLALAGNDADEIRDAIQRFGQEEDGAVA
jgi:molecular chaperone DnaK